MQIIKIITSRNVEFLKQKARKLKREESISHTQALDNVAVSIGFNHWHQVVQANDRVKPSEIAFSSGCVLAFDVKDGMDIDTSDGNIIEDEIIELLAKDQMFEIYVNTIDEDDEQKRPLKETVSEPELHSRFEEDYSFIFFRLAECHAQKPLKQVISLIQKYSFWMPQYIWLKGNLIDTYHLPSLDKDSNITGIRL